VSLWLIVGVAIFNDLNFEHLIFVVQNLDHGSLGVESCVYSINVSSSLKTVAYLMINLVNFVFIFVVLLILFIFTVLGYTFVIIEV
jgi:hypothetical protein